MKRLTTAPQQSWLSNFQHADNFNALTKSLESRMKRVLLAIHR